MESRFGATVVVVIFLSMVFLSGCQKQNVRLSEQHINKIDEVVVLIASAHTLRTVGVVGRPGFGREVAISPRLGLLRMQADEAQALTVEAMVDSLNLFIASDDFKTKLSSKIKGAIESALNTKVTKVKFVDHNYNNYYIDPNKGKVEKYVALIDFDIAVTPSIEMVDVNMDMEIYYQPDGRAYSTSKIYSGDFYFQSWPAQSRGIELAKMKLQEGLKAWGESDLISDEAVAYPWREVQELQIQNARFWADDDVHEFKKALTSAVSDSADMLRLGLVGHKGETAGKTVSVFHKDFRQSVSADDVMNKKLNGHLLMSNEERSIIRSFSNSLYSLSSHGEANTDDFDYDHMFVTLLR